MTEIVKEMEYEDEDDDLGMFTSVGNIRATKKPAMISQETQTAVKLTEMPARHSRLNKPNNMHIEVPSHHFQSQQDEHDIYSSVKLGQSL